VTVSVYNTLPAADVAWLLRDAAAKAIVTEQGFEEVATTAAAASGVPVFTVDAPRGTARPLAELVEAAGDEFDFEATWRSVGPDDLATLIYTSGTTGRPKGVELSHQAILGNQAGLAYSIGLPEGARVISFLPMAHIAERHLSHYRAMLGAFSVTCCPTPRDVPAVLGASRPEYFFSPPRLFEKLRAALLAKLPDPAAAAVQRAVDLQVAQHEGRAVTAEALEEAEHVRTTIGPPLLQEVGLDQVRVALTGAAPVPFELVAFWTALGLPLLEAWGLSECGAFGAFNKVGEARLGTVGRALPGVEMRLLADGEILLRSPWMMRGYRNRPQQTAEAIDEDGWLHSGDVGVIDDDGYLRIVDRKKEIMINAAGKNMSPANIETVLKSASPLIGVACVVGDARPYNVALLVLDPDAVAQLGRTPLRQELDAAVARANDQLSRVEQIKRFAVLDEEWLPGGDELTPTMKLKRKSIEAKYAEDIEQLYAPAG
jgi:long-subunit acyl-CoA synthetase (AMP-forming)